jgi:hypothetical protein
MISKLMGLFPSLIRRNGEHLLPSVSKDILSGQILISMAGVKMSI